MAKQLNVSLAFTANTNEAIASIKALRKELNDLATGQSLKSSGIAQLTPEIQKAMSAAGQLQAKLEAATNIDTGKLDLGKFSDSLKKSNMTLDQYAKSLNALGPAGRQAFTNLAQSIIQAEAPLVRCNKVVKELGVSLANTARWQLSSSILHGFMGAVQSAYGYAQDLNESLNNIRIVTEQTTDQMAAFAEKANKAAKALSTTTTEYTNASLIYYQQGLSDAEVAKRTAITVKMANAAGQSAQVVSDQLTAIWNNFYDGSKTLEYYADAMTALGAATASSTDEIAGGLEKFAAIGETIGLSYEYAASALATITSNTRQSEEVVGTALKTIFARIQGLNLGETLDDGTTLNKYSKALESIGISIFDSSGEMKKMDNILDEMANKWDTLSKAQQAALAQTVAGTRQYTQLIALMDNWNNGDTDSMIANLKTVENSSGALQKQADIYAESWEAAQDRVTASAEKIYSQLLNDDFFIDLLNGISTVLDGVSSLIDGFGGLKGVLLTVGAFATKVFKNEIATGLRNTAYNLQSLTAAGKKAQEKQKEEAVESLRNLRSKDTGATGKAENAALEREIVMQQQLLKLSKTLSEEELKELQIQMDIVRSLDQRAIAAAKALDVAEKELKVLQDQNRLRVKMDAQSDARAEGATKAGRDLMKFAEGAKSDNTDTLTDNEREIIKTAQKRAEQSVRSKHNFSADIKLDGYEDEIALELTKQLKGAINDATKLTDAQKETISGHLKKILEDNISKALKDADIDNVGKQVDKAQKQVKKAGAVRAHGETLSKYATSVAETFDENDAENVSQVIKELQTRIEQAQKAVQEFKNEKIVPPGAEDNIKAVEDELSGLSNKLEKAGTDGKKLKEILEQLTSETGSGEKIATQAFNISEIAQDNIRDTIDTTFNTNDQFESATIVETKKIESNNASKDVKAQQDILDKQVSDTGIQDWSNQVANATDIIIGLGSAISSVQGAIDVFNNPDSTGWDKISAIIGIIVGALPVLSSLFQTVGIAGQTAGQGINASLGVVGYIIIGITAAVVGLIAVFQVLSDAYNKDAIAAKESAEQVQMLSERYKEAEAAATSLKETISNWDDAVKALEELDHNTQEYAEALDEANKKAKELIETYGLWNDYHLEDGVIKFNDGVLERIQNEANAEANKAEQEYYQAEIYDNAVQIRKQSTDQLRETGSFGTGTYHTVYTEGGSYQVENYRQLSNDEIEYIADVANDLQQSLGGVAPTAEQLRAELQKLSGDGQLGADALSNLSSIITDSTIGGFLSLGDSMAEAAEASKYYAEQILKIGIEENYGNRIRGLATDKEGNVNQALVEQITQVFTDRATRQAEEEGRRIDEEYAAVEDDVKDIVNTGDLNDFLDDYTDEEIKAVLGDNYDGDIGNDKELGLMYASMLTGDDISTLTYKAGTGVGTVTDAEGNKVFSEISDEVMRREIAKQVAMSSITAEYTQGTSGETKTAEELAKLETALGNIISGGSEAAEKYGADFSTAILNSIANEDFESLDFSSLFTELTPQEIEELSGLDKDGILSMLGISEQDLIDAGYNVDTFISAFGTALDEWTYQLDTSGLEQKASSLNEIIDGLKTGAVIEEETVLKLQELGINIDDYFTKMADGSYRLVGIAEDLVNILKGEIQQDYINKILEAESAQVVATNTINEQYADTYAGSHWMDTSVTTLDGMGSNTQQMYQARRDYINEVGGASVFGFTEEQAALLEKSSWTWEEMQELNAMFETATQNASILQEQLFSTASSLSELDNLKGQLSSVGLEEINYNAYAEALIGLASAYENCTEEIENYNLALASGNVEEVAKAEAVLRSSVVIGEAAEKYDLSAESLEAQTKEIMKANGWTEEYAETAAILAVQNQRMNKGLTKLVNGWKDWKKTLSTTNTTSQDYADTLVELSEAVGDLVGWYEDLNLSSEFVKKNMELIDQASTGNVDAIIRLSAAVASYEVANAKLNTTIAEGLTNSGALNALMAYAQTMGEGTTAAQAFASAQAGVQAGFDLIANNLNALNNGASLTDILGGEEGMRQWVDQLNAYAAATGMTAEQMQTMLSSVGVTANVQTAYQEQEVTVPTYIEHSEPYQTSYPTYEVGPNGERTLLSPGGWGRRTWTTMGAPVTTTGYVEVASISMDGEGEPPSVPPPTFIGRQAPSASAIKGGNTGGGGGGSTPSAPDKAEKRTVTKKSDTVERYREVSDAIDNVTDALTRAERVTERLWGKDKLDAMRQENKILAEQYKLLQQKAQEAEDYAKQDYNDLMDVADEIGVSVVVDTDTGDITNIEDVEKTLYDRLAAAEAEYNRKVEAYNAAVDAAGDSPTEAKVKELETMRDALDAYEKDIIGGIEDDISAWEDAEQTFQDSVETWEDAGLEAEEILDQMMQKNFDIWSESLQLEVEVNDRDLELLDYYLSKTEDNVYQMAEAAALMVGNLNSGFEGGQLGEYIDNLSIYGEKYAELTDRLNSTDPEYQITSAQYKEGLEEIQSGLLDNLSSIQELDDTMLNYYGDTLSMVGEEIDKYTEKMEHQTSILEHYANMMDILGKSQDYEAMGTILEGQVETIKNELDVAEAEYNLYAEEAEKKRKLYEDAVAKGDAAAAELYKGEWEAAEEAAMEAQSNMLDKTEQWAEAMKAVVENKLQGLAKSLEEALTGGTSFDQINTQLERAASLQEEYLTTTNQIYETNKLMRTAQQEIDKTTNSVAKQRLKDFIKETDQLQDKSKLSKYELDIQKAKYDLLLAEIALEDAQNAKSTVRLQRDSEGNMGYIYTADQSQLSQAQQQLEDAQNSLYNIGLEGANNYAEKYNQTMQEMYDTLTSITEAYYNGEITSKEEYDRQMLEAQEYYYEQLENFQDLYGVALQTDTRVIKDAWSSSFSSMINNTSTWKDKVKIYSDEAAKTMSDWYNKVDEISQKTGLDNIANKVKTVTEESKALRDAILGNGEDKGVIEALKNELTAVSDLTGGYANLRTTIQGLITDYENLMKTVNNAQNQQQEQENKNENGTGGTSGDSDTNNGDTDTSNGNTTNDPTPGSPTTTTPTIAKGQSVTVKTTATHFSRDGGNGTRMRSFVPGGNYTVMNFDEDEVLIGKGGVATGWVKKTDLVGFATGGYTGEWGPYGKMAMLHEKELVLNQGDTANFLASMEILERILEIIDLQSLNSQLGGILYTPSIGGNNTTQTVEQSVHIEASFPGVSDRNEIEEAFNNLINTASQYANRKF